MTLPSKAALTSKDSCILSKAFFFVGLPKEEYERAIASIAPYTLHFSANQAIIKAGDTFSAIGILSEGEATVIRSGERRRVIHKTLSAGDVFGVSLLQPVKLIRHIAANTIAIVFFI